MKITCLFHKKKKSSAHPGHRKSNAHSSSDDSSSGSSNRSSRSSNHRSGHPPSIIDGLLDQQNQQLTEAFRIIDKNGDGKISRKELKDMWARIGEDVTDKEVRGMVQEVDVNGDGEIDLQEFITLNRKFGLGIENPESYDEEVQLAFNMADADRDGRISADDLRGVMKRLGVKKFTIAESYAMLRYVDHGGLINYQEFERLMQLSILGGNQC